MYRPPIYVVCGASLIRSIISQVQLESKHQASIALPTSIVTSSPGPSANKILALIADQEGAYQESLGDTYHEMGEKTFKGLRRALPLTRQKLDWDKVTETFVLSVSGGVSLIWLSFRYWGINLVQSCLPAKASLVVLEGRHEKSLNICNQLVCIPYKIF